MKKKILIFIILCFTLIGITKTNVKASNGVPYYTFTEDSNHELIPTQTAYLPVMTIDDFLDYQLLRPEDLFIDENNILYIADTGHRSILIVEENMEEVYTIGKEHLQTPKGIFVIYEDDEPMIYVADTGVNAVLKFDKQGNLLQTFTKPDHPLFGKKASFKPTKVTVDKRGNVYIIDPANLNGIIQMSKHGEFLGYFGVNYTKPSFQRMLQFIFSTKEQKAKLRMSSLSPANLILNNENLISAISNDDETGYIQSFNIAGENILGFTRTDFSSLINRSDKDKIRLVDIYIGPIGNIYIINSVGFIAEYDREGNLLFVFGGKDTSGNIKGLTNTPSSIAVDKNYNIYVLDTSNNRMHIYQPTEFACLVHEALYYYQEGFYVESQIPWEEVLKRNALFDLAHKGLGNAYLQQQMYEEALEEFKMANDKVGYSESFWELRNDWLENNLHYVLIILFIFIFDFLVLQSRLVNTIIKYVKKPFKFLDKYRFYHELTYSVYYLKHPADGCYGIKRENKVSILAALVFYFIFYIEHVLGQIYTGFIFNYTRIDQLSLLQEATNTIGILLLFVVSNYLVSSITDGEGKFKDVFKATVYSFMPVIFFLPFIILVSNFLTLNEAIIYQAANIIVWGWSIILLFVMIKEVHNYDIKETIKNIIITLFTMFMIVASLFIFYILIQHIISFILEVYLEVKANV